jgi:hypothetical protein
MALILSYRWTCDVCKGDIASPLSNTPNERTYMSGTDLTKLPQVQVVRHGMQVGNWAVCDSCWEPIADALEKRVADLRDVKK